MYHDIKIHEQMPTSTLQLCEFHTLSNTLINTPFGVLFHYILELGSLPPCAKFMHGR